MIHLEPISFQTEEAINTIIVTSKEFEELGRRIKACSKTTDLVIQWSIGPDSTTQIEYHDENSPHLIVDALVQFAESMPNLRPYSIQAHGFGIYASRKKNEAWDSLNTVRLTHEMMEYPQGDWADLLSNFRLMQPR